MMLLHPVSPFAFIILSQFYFTVFAVDDCLLASKEASTSSNIVCRGLQFGGRIYPSVDQLGHFTVSQLVSIRPPSVRYEEKSHFYQLFALHPTIRKLSAKGEVQPWANLILAEPGTGEDKRFSHSVSIYLKDILKSDDIFVRDVIRCVRRARKAKSQRLRKQNVSNKAQERRRDAIYRQKYREDAKFYEKEGALEFIKMLQDNDIDIKMPAKELEVATRPFGESLGGAQATTTKLKRFLLQRNAKENGINPSIEMRVAYNRRLYVTRMIQTRKKMRQARKLQRLLRSNHEGGKLQCDVDPVGTSDVMCQLIRASKWWLP